MIERIETVEYPQVGERYRVREMRASWCRIEGWWPIFGPTHTETQPLSILPRHAHIDPRFLRHYNAQWTHIVVDVRGCSRRESALIYRRHMPLRHCRIWNFQALEYTFRDARLLPGTVCPHKGAPLRGLLLDAHGCVECPLHGLRWHLRIGKLRRSSWTTENF
jgi:hypothetical protein